MDNDLNQPLSARSAKKPNRRRVPQKSSDGTTLEDKKPTPENQNPQDSNLSKMDSNITFTVEHTEEDKGLIDTMIETTTNPMLNDKIEEPLVGPPIKSPIVQQPGSVKDKSDPKGFGSGFKCLNFKKYFST